MTRVFVAGFGVAAVVLLCGAPVAALAAHAWLAPGDLPFTALRWDWLAQSALLSCAVAVVALLLGAPAGALAARWRVRGLAVLALLMALPLLLPRYLLAEAWVDFTASDGPLGVRVPAALLAFPLTTLVLALAFAPITFGASSLAFAHIPQASLDAARVITRPRGVWWRVAVPLAWPMLAAAAIATAMLTFLEMPVPHLFQLRVFAVEVYTHLSAFHDTRAALLAGAVNIGVGAVGMIAIALLLRRGQRQLTGAPAAPTPASANTTALAWLAFAPVLLLGVLLPIYTLLLRAGSVATLGAIALRTRGELLLSLEIALASALLAAAVALACCVSRYGLAVALALAGAAYLVSGPVLGVGLVTFWNHAGLRGAVYDSVAILVVASIAQSLIFALLPLAARRHSLARLPLDAARANGFGPVRTAAAIVLPQLAPAALLGAGLVAVLSFAALDVALLVSPPGATPLPVRLFALMHYGPRNDVAAIALLQMGTLLAMLAAAFPLLRRYWKRHAPAST